jgi:hypothetical protein
MFYSNLIKIEYILILAKPRSTESTGCTDGIHVECFCCFICLQMHSADSSLCLLVSLSYIMFLVGFPVAYWFCVHKLGK